MLYIRATPIQTSFRELALRYYAQLLSFMNSHRASEASISRIKDNKRNTVDKVSFIVGNLLFLFQY